MAVHETTMIGINDILVDKPNEWYELKPLAPEEIAKVTPISDAEFEASIQQGIRDRKNSFPSFEPPVRRSDKAIR